MADTVVSSPTHLTFHVRDDMPAVNLTQQLTLNDPSDPVADYTLAKVGSAGWLTIPATVGDEEEFDVTVDPTWFKLNRARYGTFTETIRASHVALDDHDTVVTVRVEPGGPPS